MQREAHRKRSRSPLGQVMVPTCALGFTLSLLAVMPARAEATSSTAEAVAASDRLSSPAAVPAVQALRTDITAPGRLRVDLVRAAATTAVLRASWSAVDGSSGVASYDVRVRGRTLTGSTTAYRTVLIGSTARSLAVKGAAGETRCAAVRARDRVGNVSAWSADSCVSVPLDDRSLAGRTGVVRVRDRAAFAGTLTLLSNRGTAVVSPRLSARSLALLVRRCPTCGTVVARWNGRVVRTVALAGRPQAVSVPLASFARPTAGTLTLTVTSSRRPVRLDGVQVDSPPLSGSLRLNGGRGWANAAAITYEATATGGRGAVSVRVAPGTAPGGSWRPITAAAAVTLAGTDGLRTVTAQFRDAAGTLSSPVTESVSLDRVPPAVSVIDGSRDVTAGAPTTLRAQVADGSPLTSVVADTTPADPPGTTTRRPMVGASGGFEASVTPATTTAYTITATDAAGNTTTEPEAADGPFVLSVPSPPTIQDHIAADLEAGTITYATSLAYRAFTLFADPRLPATYTRDGSTGEDLTLFREIAEALPDLTPGERAEVEPFLARPGSAGSVFAPVVARSGRTRAAAPPPVDPRPCPTAWAHSDGAHFRVHSCGATDPGRAKLLAIADGLWDPMTAAAPSGMGEPVGDDKALDNGGNGLVDIYILDGTTCIRREGTCEAISGDTVAAMVPGDPVTVAGNRRTSSGFLLVTRERLDSPAIAADVSHEFFHLLQAAQTTRTAKRVGTRTAADGKKTPQFATSWFEEASAEWASWRWTRDAALEELKGRLFSFQRHPKPLITYQDPGTAQYNAWIWPWFMTDQGAASAVIDAWTSSHDVTDPASFDKVINAQLGFLAHYRDFAVRNVNRNLPGSPFLRWADLPGASTFPGPPAIQPTRNAASVQDAATLVLPVDINVVSAQYDKLLVKPDSGKVTLDFSGLAKTANLDVDLVVKNRLTKLWKRIKVDGTKAEFCTAKADEDYERVYVVLSNHSFARYGPTAPPLSDGRSQEFRIDPREAIVGDYTVHRGPCATATGTIGWQFNHQGAFNGGTSTYRETGSITLSLNQLEAPAPGFPTLYGFADDTTSTYSVSAQEVFENPPDINGCVTTVTSTVDDTGHFVPDGRHSLAVDASDPSNPYLPGAAARITLSLILAGRAVVTTSGGSCTDPPPPSDTTFLIPYRLQCVPPPIPAGAVGAGPQLIGVRTTVAGKDGYTFTCTGQTARFPGFPVGQMSVTGRLTVAPRP